MLKFDRTKIDDWKKWRADDTVIGNFSETSALKLKDNERTL